MKKQELIRILEKLLQSEGQLDFLEQLSETDLETLVACIRNRINPG